MKTFGCIGAVISFIIAAILIFFGVLFILGSGDPQQGQTGWFGTGLLMIFIGFVFIIAGGVAIYFSKKAAPTASSPANVTLNIDLPGNVALDSLKCKSCGGALTKDSIQVVNGAPMVTCPFCNSVYQLTEEPKW